MNTYTYLLPTQSPLQNFETLLLPNFAGVTEETFHTLKTRQRNLAKLGAIGFGIIISAIGTLFALLKDYKTIRNTTATFTFLSIATSFYQFRKIRMLEHEIELKAKNDKKIFNDICALLYRQLLQRDSIIISLIEKKQIITEDMDQVSQKINAIVDRYHSGHLYLDENSKIIEVSTENNQKPNTENAKICSLAREALAAKRPKCGIIPLQVKLKQACRDLIVGKKGEYQILAPGMVRMTKNYVQLEQNPTTKFWEAKQFSVE